MLRSDLCDYSSVANIILKRIIDPLAAAENKNNNGEKNAAFKNNAPFSSYISKINSTLIEIAENLDIVIPMYNLFEHSQNYSMTSGILWNYYGYEINISNDNGSDGK